eukprot:TRINITY_DN26265_c0_g1_i1.p1 TRINITY_DN26265_c0_g1~~TRINITY_DN26265_c0_g1_i1.p1  ORF type:complete len:372 (+),score=86.48 TRINITY_DN26265_c0_g1_i1:46-1161(+)
MLKKKDEAPTLSLSAISCHAYNSDRTQVALSLNDAKILIYDVEGTDSAKWKLAHTLEAHDMTVLDINWGSKTNNIVSCSEDLTAYVWQFIDGKWKAELVVMDSKGCSYAGLRVKWSPAEKKFAIGTGSGRVFVCYFDSTNSWWVAKGGKAHTSSVTALDWMPGGDGCDLILATGSTDCRLNITSAYLKPVDGKVANPGKAGKSIGSISLKGWVHDIAFSADGNTLAAVSHDSSISWVDTSSTSYDKSQTLKLNLLPFNSVIFVSDDTCVAGGNDFYPVAFKKTDDKWELVGKWVATRSVEKKTSASKAMAMFQDQETFGGAQVKKAASTHHRSAITRLALIKYGSSFSFSSCGSDGAIYVFKAADMVPFDE